MTASAFGAAIRRGLVLAVAAAALAVVLLLPPARQMPADADWTPAAPAVSGAYHVHSVRSDGSGTVEEIAAAAAEAGLDFVILTDHGDGTRRPEPPAYRSGVLCIDAVEISTSGGHYVALGARQAPYPLGGAPQAVVEDVARLGGMGIVAHPDSAKPELRWGDWGAAFDGVEWLNADSEWRDESTAGLARLLITYGFRPVETLASALDRPVATLERWDALTKQRRVPALAGADAHARIGSGPDPYRDRAIVRLPGYAVSFETFHNHVVLDRPLSRRDAAADAERVLAGIRAGRIYTTIDGLAGAGAFEFEGHADGEAAPIGGYLDGGRMVLTARVAAPPDSTLVLLRDGVPVETTRASTITASVADRPGAYRVEVRLAGRPPVPWLISNPIYAGLRAAHAAAVPAARARPAAWQPVPLAGAAGEADAATRNSVGVDEPAVAGGTAGQWSFALAPGERGPQYAAMRIPIGGLAGARAVTLRLRAERPMRAWLQLRAPSTRLPAGERWGRTFYADETEREITIDLDELAPIGVTASAAPALDRVDSLLLVADTINTAPGTGNRVELRGVAIGR